MGLTNSNKVVSTNQMGCSDYIKITLALAASPDIISNPTDIVLILDRSGSMAGSALANLKLGAKKFISIIDEATDGSQDGQIGSGSRIGIVSFADTAVQNTQLITSVDALNAAVDSLTAGGATNHADAFEKGAAMFDPASSNARVMVMFTDGKTTAGPNPDPVAAAARASGIIIYCIGLVGADGIDPNVLNEWATDPDASHVAITPDDGDLENLFEDLAANIAKPGATDIFLKEEVHPDFAITGILTPVKGTAALVNSTTLTWSIDELGTTANEGASLEFFVQHVGTDSGTKLINRSITYTDSENNQATFPEPSVTVDCGAVVHPETVVLLSKLNTKQHIEVELNLDELDLTAAESKATYDEIKAYVLEKYGLKVSSLYISQVKRKCGLDVGQNYNLSKKEDAKVPQCPSEKEAAIMEALKHFHMV